MSLFRPDRVRQQELLDSDAGSSEEIAQSLGDLSRINRYLGGHRTSLIPIRQLVSRFSFNHFSLLDVATGGADLPIAVVHWARQRRIRCQVVGMDLSLQHLTLARKTTSGFPEIELIQADIEHMSFLPASFDFVNSSLFLHHLDDEVISRFLNTLLSLARVAVIINDLERHWVPYLCLKLMRPIFARSRITQFDSFASLLQGFTAGELNRIGLDAGISHFAVMRRFPYRLALVMLNPGILQSERTV